MKMYSSSAGIYRIAAYAVERLRICLCYDIILFKEKEERSMLKKLISAGFVAAAICLIANMILRALGSLKIANALMIAGGVLLVVSGVSLAITAKSAKNNRPDDEANDKQ